MGESIRERIKIVQECLGDVSVDRVLNQGKVTGQHGRLARLGRVKRIRDLSRRVYRLPLVGTAGTGDERPLVVEKTEEDIAVLVNHV